MHHDRRLVSADLGDHLADALDQVEPAALPVARQVLRAAVDRAVPFDQAGAADADEGSNAEARLAGLLDLGIEHLAEPLDCVVAIGLLVGVAPEFGLPDLGLGEVRRLVLAQLDDAGANIRAADIDGDEAVIGLEDPFRRKMGATDQPGLVGMMADRHKVDTMSVGLQDDAGTRDRKLADPALAESAADHDTLDGAPGLQPGEAANDEGQRLGVAFDGAEDESRLARLT